MRLLFLLFFCSALQAQTTKIVNLASLQFYWPFEDNTGTTATAKYGGTNGTLTGGTAWAEGLLGHCVSLDGTNDYVTFGTAFQPAVTQAFSIACWVKPTVLDVTTRNIISSTAGGTGWFLGAANAADQMTFKITDAVNFKQAVSAAVLTTGNWYYVVATWDGSATASVYLDTVKTSNTSSSGTVGAIVYAGITTDVGRWSNNTRFWGGLVDDLKCYYHALSQSEVNYQFYSKRRSGWGM